MSILTIVRPDLSVRLTRRKLAKRVHPYWHFFSYGRHLGYLRRGKMKTYWIARARNLQGGYVQRRLGLTDDQQKADGVDCLSFEQAGRAAWAWFQDEGVRGGLADAFPVGIQEKLNYTPVGDVFTVGHALHDYLEWKRLVAAKSYLQTLVVLINYHLLPRVGGIPAENFNGERLKEFVRDVLETPPKPGNASPRVRRSIESLDEESLRKRKATVNTLIGILRVALKMAWENGKLENGRSWQALRRVPNVVRPRILHLSRPECRTLLAHCSPDLARLVLAALYTGCRITELLRMRASHVGRDGYGVYVTPVKKYRPRFVFLPDEGMVFFLALAKSKRPNDLLFVRDDRRQWYSHHRHAFKNAVKAAALPTEFTFHGLRHTYASQLIQSGAPLPVVAEQLGHSNSDTVSRTYGHLSPQIRESEVRQRFTTLSRENARLATTQNARLKRWRSALHGSNWRTYAAITDASGD